MTHKRGDVYLYKEKDFGSNRGLPESFLLYKKFRNLLKRKGEEFFDNL